MTIDVGHWAPTQATADRIRRAYLQALETHEPESSATWADHIPSRQRDVHEALLAGGKRLTEMLGRLETTNLYYGVDHICSDILSQLPPDVPPFDRSIFDRIRRLVEITGCGRTWNPEAANGATPEFQPAVQPEVRDLLSALDRGLPSPPAFPNPFRGEVGLHTERGIISDRAVQAIYQAYRLAELARLLRSASRFVEIGAGMGRTAFYSNLIGLTDYTIIDLPMTLVGQACFLSATLGEQNICLFGEDEKSDAIRLYPPQWLFAKDRKFDIAINVDSLTEMSRAYADRYVAFVRAHCRAFISINHEINPFTVRELLPEIALRFPYALRPGYVEEIFLAG
jgi:hypothetical protein